MPGTVISLATRRTLGAPDGQPDDPEEAIGRLRQRITPRTIVYVVLRYFESDNDWLICDFYLIEGQHVALITEDVTRVLGRHDQHREVGMKLSRQSGRDPLRDLIDRDLSRLLCGAADVVRHVVIR